MLITREIDAAATQLQATTNITTAAPNNDAGQLASLVKPSTVAAVAAANFWSSGGRSLSKTGLTIFDLLAGVKANAGGRKKEERRSSKVKATQEAGGIPMVPLIHKSHDWLILFHYNISNAAPLGMRNALICNQLS